MKILLTGSEGFIGKHLFARFTNLGYEIVCVDKKIGTTVFDIKDLDNIDAVVHMAAQTSVWNENAELVVEDNINSFIYLNELCKKFNVRFIYASSSCSVNVTSIYGLTKKFDDEYMKLYGKDYVGLRFHNVYGKNSREDTLLGICLHNDVVKLFNNGKNLRHFTYIDDICKAVEKALTLPTGIYNVFNPDENSTYDFLKEVSKYKPIRIITTTEIREKDKEQQYIDTDVPNLIEKTAIGIKEGIKNVFK